MASYFGLAIAILVLRYAVLPRVDDWRDQIAAIASRALDAPVAVARIAADWQGLHPRLYFEGLHVRDAGGATVLAVPQARATLAWRSVLFLSPQLLSLELSGLDVTVQRDAAGEVWLAGQKLSAQDDATDAATDAATAGDGTDHTADPTSNQTLAWLLAQRELVLREATLRWRDGMKDAARQDADKDANNPADLVLTDTRIRLLNTPLASQFSIATRPPARLAAGLSVQAELRRNLLVADRASPRAWSGQLYVQLDDAAPRAWLDWLPDMANPVAASSTTASITTPQGQFAARAWFDVTRGQLTNVVADLAARKLDWRDIAETKAVPATRVQADTFQLRLAGSPRDVLAGLAGSAFNADAMAAPASTDPNTTLGTALSTTLTANNLTLTLPGVFDPAVLTLQTLSSEASIQHTQASGWTVPVRRLDFANADVAGRLTGVWQSAGRSRAGTLDMQGQLTRIALKTLHRYLPTEVNPDARAWLAGALTGQADGVAVTVRGDLADFPFDQPNDPSNQTNPGQFRMAGTFRDTQIDYAPAREQSKNQPARKGWPKLSQLRGAFELERAGLRLRVQGGQLHTGPSATVTLIRANADIPDMNHNATLRLEADSSGAAADYLAMMAHSPLGELLNHHYDQAHSDGNWRVPLALTVPLLDSEQTQVQGRIEFNGNGLTLMPDIPRFTQLTGALAFTEHGVAAEKLSGQFLGGPVRISGELARNAAGLQLTGTARAEALAAQWPMPAMQRLSGQADYTARLLWQPSDDLDIHIASPLTGMALDFPAPLSKPAHEPLPTTVSWGPGRHTEDGKSMPGRWLDVRLGERAEVLLAIAPDTDSASYFARADVTVGQDVDANAPRIARPTSGLTLNWRQFDLDVAAWDAALDEFTLPDTQPNTQPDTQPRQSARPLLPPLTRIDVASAHLRLPFMTLSDATLAIDINPDARAPAWYGTMRAVEATGDWIWRAPSEQTPGQFTGRFAHLSWGKKDDEDADADTDTSTDDSAVQWFAADTALDFPDVDVAAQQFTLYGRELGTLTVTGGNVERGQLWRATNVTLANDDATLQGAGVWRLAPSPPTALPQMGEGSTAPGLPPSPASGRAVGEEGQPPSTPRGLTLDATLTVHDLGRFMARLGIPDRVAGGSGSATGTFTWQNLPWQRRDADLTGRVTIALEKGVFLRASSFSARLLELLSLQSLSRLSRLDVRPDAIFRDGFRFDTIRAELGLTGSRLHASDDENVTEGITVDSPIATLLLAGDTDWRSEHWNLQAAVVPKLDASGAAIAAGIAINPLVGVGALIAQWLLKQPVARAMTARYTVTGTWDEPEIKPVETPARASGAARVDP